MAPSKKNQYNRRTIKMIDEFEDRYFGELALERLENVRKGKSKVLTHEEVLSEMKNENNRN